MSTAARPAGSIPKDWRLESAGALLRRGYCFIGDTCRELGTDVFETRLMLRKTICCLGREAAGLIYDEQLFERRGAAPRRVRKTLTGSLGVQNLDGLEHAQRKRVLMSLLNHDAAVRLRRVAAAEWAEAAARWREKPSVVLFDESVEVLCRAACMWCGVPLRERDVSARARDFAAMIAGGGSVGFAHWAARRARTRMERWAEGLIRLERARAGARENGDALAALAAAGGSSGAPLDARVAAVELLNILRPTVAVAYFVTFAALALERYPECRGALLECGDDRRLLFVQEVRRFYPFFPFIGARVREDFVWHGYRFARGRRVLLDIYGTNHDERIWSDPQRFWPERFERFRDDGFSFIPQGGGAYLSGHRCAGERVTVELLLGAVEFLTRSVTYRVPPQADDVDLSRMPARPRSGLVLEKVAPRG